MPKCNVISEWDSGRESTPGKIKSDWIIYGL